MDYVAGVLKRIDFEYMDDIDELPGMVYMPCFIDYMESYAESLELLSHDLNEYANNPFFI